VKEAIIEFVIGFVVGVVSFAWVISHDHDSVIVHGVKDSFQTVEWNGKNYRLDLLDKVGKP